MTFQDPPKHEHYFVCHLTYNKCAWCPQIEGDPEVTPSGEIIFWGLGTDEEN